MYYGRALMAMVLWVGFWPSFLWMSVLDYLDRGFRSYRWVYGVGCPRCGSGGVIRHGRLHYLREFYRYLCRGCGRCGESYRNYCLRCGLKLREKPRNGRRENKKRIEI
jgi:hypothetical protein